MRLFSPAMVRLRQALRALVAGPQALAFLPALVLTAFWIGGEGWLVAVALGLPAVMALNGGLHVTAEASAFGMSGEMCAIWFGILVVKMAEFCLITPPIGLNCFVVAGVRDDLSVQDVFKGVMPFFVADAVTIALLVAFPGIVLWLPTLAGN